MPGGDGTGPQGRGPMTGRGAGFCAGYGVAGYANPQPRGGGLGRGGLGRGRGWRGAGGGFRGRRAAVGAPIGVPADMPAPAVVPSQEGLAEELSALRQQTANLVSTLDGLLGRIEAIESRRNTKE